MGNCIEDYRVAIGLFQFRKRKCRGLIDYRAEDYLEILLTNIRCSFLVVSLFVHQSTNPNIDIIFLLFILHTILIIGNVEVNPGPEINNISSAPLDVHDNSLIICNLNISQLENSA